MENKTVVEWLKSKVLYIVPSSQKDDLLRLFEQAKQMEKERASTFGIRVFPECSSLKTGRMEIDLHKFENLLNEMYGE